MFIGNYIYNKLNESLLYRWTYKVDHFGWLKTTINLNGFYIWLHILVVHIKRVKQNYEYLTYFIICHMNLCWLYEIKGWTILQNLFSI